MLTSQDVILNKNFVKENQKLTSFVNLILSNYPIFLIIDAIKIKPFQNVKFV